MRHRVLAAVRLAPALIACVIWVVLLAATRPAIAAPVDLKVLATDPAPDALLARQQPFYVRFALQISTPAAVTVSALYKGKPVIDDGGTGTPALLSASGGTGVVSFFYWGEKPTRIDEVRLKISDPQSGAAISEYKFPVTLTWLTDDPPLREPAAWVREWQQAQQAARARTARTTGADDVRGAQPVIWFALAALALFVAAAVVRLRRRAAAGRKPTP
jgi:hypothetical protein